MRGRYLVQRRVGYLYLRALDFVLGIFASRKPVDPAVPRRLLIGVGGHLGDAVLATSILQPIRDALPGVEIGVAGPSWARAAFEGHPLVRWVHFVDHWKTNRSGQGRMKKLWHWARSHQRARTQLREVGYDASIDLYPYYPNNAALFAAAGIPVRLGYASGGGAPTLTAAVEWSPDSTHMALKHRALVNRLIPLPETPLSYNLPPVRPADAAAAAGILSAKLPDSGYVVLHPGSGDSRKGWPTSDWASLATHLRKAGMSVAVTGSGDNEAELARILTELVPGCVDLTNATTIPMLRVILRGASAVVAVDSAAAHLAAAEGTPVVTIMGSLADPEHWRPLGPKARVLAAAASDSNQTIERRPGVTPPDVLHELQLLTRIEAGARV
jgi:ADP-heptose:LPS heptosyltransferase